MSDFNLDEWMRAAWGDPVEIPLSLLSNKKISWGAKGLYGNILCLDNPSQFNPEDFVTETTSLKKVLRWLQELRKWGYLPDEDAS